MSAASSSPGSTHIPFLAWTIIPYWSINLFYGLSLFINATTQRRRPPRRPLPHARNSSPSPASSLFPLTATFVAAGDRWRPVRLLFAVLGGFDKPFNQAPSLHIALLVIIWDHSRHRYTRTASRIVWHVWCFLIGASVLTTWQHHFIDIPTGALLGLFALWLFPAPWRLALCWLHA